MRSLQPCVYQSLPMEQKALTREFPQPASRYALVGCAVVRFADGKTNIAFTGVAENAFRDTGAEQAISGQTH